MTRQRLWSEAGTNCPTRHEMPHGHAARPSNPLSAVRRTILLERKRAHDHAWSTLYSHQRYFYMCTRFTFWAPAS